MLINRMNFELHVSLSTLKFKKIIVMCADIDTVVFMVSYGDAAPVQCMLILVLITLNHLENQHIDLHND